MTAPTCAKGDRYACPGGSHSFRPLPGTRNRPANSECGIRNSASHPGDWTACGPGPPITSPGGWDAGPELPPGKLSS